MKKEVRLREEGECSSFSERGEGEAEGGRTALMREGRKKRSTV